MSTAAPEKTTGRFDWGKFFRDYSILLILVGLVILLSILTGGVFLRVRNLLNVLRQVSVVAIIALGVTMVIITGGIDLSSGSIVALVSVVVGSLIQTVK